MKLNEISQYKKEDIDENCVEYFCKAGSVVHIYIYIYTPTQIIQKRCPKAIPEQVLGVESEHIFLFVF